jgi:lipoprotein-anchoring transpeptidase ErfK/SrfK
MGAGHAGVMLCTNEFDGRGSDGLGGLTTFIICLNCAEFVMRFSIGLLAIIVTSSLLGTCAANSAPKAARESASEKSGQVWSLQTPFGIIYERIPSQEVDYPSTRPAGTIVVSISERRLYYVLGGGRAISYGIAVGMEGYGWSGVSTVSAKREWPDWTPTPNILKRFPNLPRHMAGGPDNPLGARALYLGGTLYRIHGTNEPWKLGGDVSSGCIRLSNDDIIDLYNRTKIGATVIVQQ